eukprot:jgi/Galph1/4971/GphlegSOOS_G3670.1
MARSFSSLEGTSQERGSTVQRTTDNNDFVISEMSQRLLQGWTLLGEVCPLRDCHTPLVRKSGVTFCCKCQAQVVVGGTCEENNNIANGMVSSLTCTGEQEATEEDNGKQQEDLTVVEEERNIFDREQLQQLRENSDGISRLIGEKLLLGWALLDTSCSNLQCGCPLMKDNQGRLLCLSCQKYYQDNLSHESSLENTEREETDKNTRSETLEPKRPRTMSSMALSQEETVDEWMNSILARGNQVLRTTEAILLSKVEHLHNRLLNSENIDEWSTLNEKLSSCLANLHSVRSLLSANKP